MKINNWLLQESWLKKIQGQETSPYGLKNETESLRASCITSIVNDTEDVITEAEALQYKLSIKVIQNISSLINRDSYGNEILRQNPVFTSNEVASITSAFIQNLLLIVFFTGCEGFIYYAVSVLLLPTSPLAMRIPVAMFMALTVMYGLHLGYKEHFIYKKINSNSLNDQKLPYYRGHKIWSYLVGAAALVTLVAAGVGRMYFLHHADLRGLSPEKAASVRQANVFIGVAMFAATICTSFLLARAKYDLGQVAERFSVLQKWISAIKKRNRHSLKLQGYGRDIQFVIKKLVEKYWMLTIDLKRVFKAELEFDRKYLDLHGEYIALKEDRNFMVTADIYQRFSVLQSAYEELFKFGIYNDPTVIVLLQRSEEFLATPALILKDHTKVPEEKIKNLMLPALPIVPSVQKKNNTEKYSFNH